MGMVLSRDVVDYLVACRDLCMQAAGNRRNIFDLRAESIWLTAVHTLARIHRGAA